MNSDSPLLASDDWERHWQDYADAASNNPAQRLRRRVIRSLLALEQGRLRVLDIGCGQGDLLRELHAAYPEAQLCGVDYSRSGVQIARHKVPTAEFLCRDLVAEDAALGRLGAWATHAVCSEVLEHVDDPPMLLRNVAAFLAPGSRLVVTVPGGPMSAFDRHIGHRKHFTANELRGLLTSAGFEVEKATGVGFPFFNLYRLVIVRRGEKLLHDLADGGGRTSLPARVGLRVFSWLLALGTPESRWGWQIVAVAHLPPLDPVS